PVHAEVFWCFGAAQAMGWQFAYSCSIRPKFQRTGLATQRHANTRTVLTDKALVGLAAAASPLAMKGNFSLLISANAGTMRGTVSYKCGASVETFGEVTPRHF
ncbi:MAG: hypothetical protein RLZ68_1082, partial [Pseudomonadota bacterium]